MLCGPPHKAKLPAKDDGTPTTPSWGSLPSQNGRGPGISHGPYAKSCLHCHSIQFCTRESIIIFEIYDKLSYNFNFHSYHKGKHCHLWNCHLSQRKNCLNVTPPKTNGRFTWKKEPPFWEKGKNIPLPIHMEELEKVFVDTIWPPVHPAPLQCSGNWQGDEKTTSTKKATNF